MARLAQIAKQYGSEVAGTVIFAMSPVHTDARTTRTKFAGLRRFRRSTRSSCTTPPVSSTPTGSCSARAHLRRERWRQAHRDALEQPHGDLRHGLLRGRAARRDRAAHHGAIDGQWPLDTQYREHDPQYRADGLYALRQWRPARTGLRPLRTRRQAGGLPRQPVRRVRPVQHAAPDPRRHDGHPEGAARAVRDDGPHGRGAGGDTPECAASWATP